MDENKKTLVYVGVAVVLAVLAFIVAPNRITSDEFLDQGTEFYPEFTDPNTALTLEVIEFDESSGSAKPFKVTFSNGRWIIPSHHNYPADAREHLAQTAAGLIGLKKDDFRGSNVADLESFGLVDPLDQTAGLTGRGTRMTIRGEGEQLLVDFVFGGEVPESPDYRFVRTPSSSRVYATKVDVALSTRFQDWIDTDLLQTSKFRASRIILKDYSVDERTRRLNQRDVVTLDFLGDTWKSDKMPSDRVVDSVLMQQMLGTLDSLVIVGVRPKPEGLSATLKVTDEDQDISQQDARSLLSKGFYIGSDGRLLSNEGELQLHTLDGILYTLRFGEVVFGSEDEVSAGGTDQKTTETMAENRYLFVSAQFEPNLLPEPPRPTDTSFVGKADSLLSDADRGNRDRKQKHDKWRRDVANGEAKARQLNDRFADWYYVISAQSYERLHLKRSDLVVKKQ